MPTVIGIRFKDSGKTYHFDPRNLPLQRGDWVIVETVRGPELGRVATGLIDLADDQIIGELKPVLRRATQADLDHLHQLQQREPEALQICAEKIAAHQLPMRLVKAEYNFDGSRLTFYFTAEKRVDFRALVRDLARTFRTRIELRQIGPRDEAKLLGGIGPCGRLLCCATFLPDFARVSIKMAKDQDLPLNPSKISGVCGRLLCCLSYEHEQYLQIKAELPQRGDWVQTREGPGEVVAVNVVKENVTVELYNGNTIECAAQEILEVRKRVAAEAQARNAAGITPVAQMRGTSQPLGAGEDGLLDEELDPEALATLEHDETPPRRSVPPRADAALGDTLGRRAAAAKQPAAPRRASAPPPPEHAPSDPPAAATVETGGTRSQRRRRRKKAKRQAAAPTHQAQPPAQPPAATPSSPEQGSSAGTAPRRRRQRRRGHQQG
ncbi:PSP1 domain-containing protein [Kallotenue papyrolyticum]|uniref:PSP1 domain-containing protein n=1 Tax=Kallotenue papyrolyticum TaxID=1325125 RepID=UPI000492C66C|nr:stage 0 sporulation family protein [Kallotenue papyrolyticum]